MVIAPGCLRKLLNSEKLKLFFLQHVYIFTQHLKYGTKSSKRQLDCGGVVTTVLAACQLLALQHGHTDLAACRFQVISYAK